MGLGPPAKEFLRDSDKSGRWTLTLLLLDRADISGAGLTLLPLRLRDPKADGCRLGIGWWMFAEDEC